jgi:hypothetical protein
MPTSFIFLQGLDKSYGGGVRAHVLRNYHAQKENHSQPRSRWKRNGHRRDTARSDGSIDNGNVFCRGKGLWDDLTPESELRDEEDEQEFPLSRTKLVRRSKLKEPSEALTVDLWGPKTSWTVFDTLPADISMRERFLLYECKETSPRLSICW